MNRAQKSDLIARVLSGENDEADSERFTRRYESSWLFRLKVKRLNRRAEAAREIEAVLSAVHQDGRPMPEGQIASITAAMFAHSGDSADELLSPGVIDAEGDTEYPAVAATSRRAQTTRGTCEIASAPPSDRISDRTRQIAGSFLNSGMKKLREICEGDGKLELFGALEPFLVPADSEDAWAEARELIARQLGLDEAVADVELARLRSKLSQILQEAMRRRGGTNTIRGHTYFA